MGYFRQVDHPTAGRFESVGPPFELSQHAMAADRPAPALGAEGAEVLAAAGLTPGEIVAALDDE